MNASHGKQQPSSGNPRFCVGEDNRLCPDIYLRSTMLLVLFEPPNNILQFSALCHARIE